MLLSACVASGSGTFGMGGSTGPGPAPSGPPPGETEGAYGGAAENSGGGAGVAPPSGPAEPRWDDLAFAVRERSGTYYGPWVFTKFTTFKVGKTCYAKLGEKDSGSLSNSPYYIRSVLELAKKWTGDDWDRIENQRSDRAKDRALVEPMMNEFSKRFHMTISVEGEDCETERDAWWIRYWYSIGTAFAEYPPMAGSLDVTLQVTAAARDITVEVDETGSKFVFTAPRHIEPKDWSEKLEKPFRRHAKKL
ncbi:MAG: hypothetical protein AB7T06_09190 [Kofleriaceae bacterium]